MNEAIHQRSMSGEPMERQAQLRDEIQQCRIQMVYGSLVERRRLERQIMRAEAELCRMGA
ncbi:MAG TPA: hypothetical protein VGL60_03605 [Acidimicrobiales bacterium]|jgi:hypothetical protein